MVKLIAGLKRKPGMTRAEFHRYWRDVHAPLVQTIPEFFGLVRKYVQSHALGGERSEAAGFPRSEFDGVWNCGSMAPRTWKRRIQQHVTSR